jgi:hypothetical protein
MTIRYDELVVFSPKSNGAKDVILEQTLMSLFSPPPLLGFVVRRAYINNLVSLGKQLKFISLELGLCVCSLTPQVNIQFIF